MAHKDMPYTEREYKEIDKVTELPVGDYDAVRVLRHALQLAEKGEIDQVVVICCKHHAEGEGSDLWACWSDMVKLEVLWLQRWFNSWLNKRYFGDFHEDPD